MSDSRLLVMAAAAANGGGRRRSLPPSFNFASQVVTLPSSANWNAAAYNQSNDTWAVVARGTTKAATSSGTPTAWTARTLPGSDSWGQPSRDFTGGFVVASHGSAASATGSDSWIAGGAPSSAAIECSANTGGDIITVQNSSGTRRAMITSSGASWADSAGTLPSTLNGWTSIAGINTPTVIWVAVDKNGNWAKSTDSGANWTTGAFSSLSAWVVAANGSGAVGSSPRFLAVEISSDEYAYSNDGSTWTEGTLPASRAWCQPVWCANAWVLVAEGSDKALTSPDAVTWTEHTLAATVATIGAGDLRVWPAQVNGQVPRTIVPQYGTSNAILITTH